MIKVDLERLLHNFGMISLLAANVSCGDEPNPPEKLPFYYECIFNYDCNYDETCVNGQCAPIYSASEDNSKPDTYPVKSDIEENPSCPVKYFEDKDGDGYGNYKAWNCDPTLGIEDNSDCNDYDSLVHPEASDYCSGDGVDNNCDGKVDEEGISHYQKGCSNGDVYWFDSCGSVGDLFEDCIEGYVCSGAECVCQPNCSGKECGDDGCGGSCGGCGTCKECSVNNECVEMSAEKIITDSICTITDSIGFSLNGAGHNLKTDCTESGGYDCPSYEGISCNYFSHWIQVDLSVKSGAEVLILYLEGNVPSSSLTVQLDDNKINQHYQEFSYGDQWSGSEKWFLDGCSNPGKGYILPIINWIDITADGKITASFQGGSGCCNNWELYYTQIYSCTCPKGE